MSFSNNSPVKKEILCKFGCQTAIKFHSSQISVTGKKIPLNQDGTPHNCPLRPFNKLKQIQQTHNNAARSAITCKYCSQQITFKESIASARGKKIPLNSDGSHHDCPQRPFNQARSSSNSKKEMKGPDFVN